MEIMNCLAGLNCSVLYLLARKILTLYVSLYAETLMR